MTAIITKQNAKDKAFINNGGDGEFDNFHIRGNLDVDGKANIYGTATVKGDILMTSLEPQSLTEGIKTISEGMSNAANVITEIKNGIKSSNETLTNHERRITTLENSGDKSSDTMLYEGGVDDFIITSDSLSETQVTPDEYSLTIKINLGSYTGEVFEIELPSYMKLPKAIITKTSTENMFKNPIINASGGNYELIYQEDDIGAKIYMSNKKGDRPLNLFTSGFMKINYIAKQSTNTSCQHNDSNIGWGKSS